MSYSSEVKRIYTEVVEQYQRSQRRVDQHKIYKNFLSSSGITKIFFFEVTPQLLPLSLCRKSDLMTDPNTMKSDFLLKQGPKETEVAPLNHSDQVDG